ncbi:Uncharacterised protein [Klebsiella quasipneumoniae]|nr:Uncharacterised protein [Klebsiella quasipneumoniae]SLR13234.1 Uncharacterised protein [Klebsiella quasipneumoniae]
MGLKAYPNKILFQTIIAAENFDANPSDLIYWPNEWFQD